MSKYYNLLLQNPIMTLVLFPVQEMVFMNIILNVYACCYIKGFNPLWALIHCFTHTDNEKYLMHFVHIKLSAWALLRYLENDWKCWEENLVILIRVSLCFPKLSGIKFLCDSEFYPTITIHQQTWAEIVCTTCFPSIFKEDAHGS